MHLCVIVSISMISEGKLGGVGARAMFGHRDELFGAWLGGILVGLVPLV